MSIKTIDRLFKKIKQGINSSLPKQVALEAIVHSKNMDLNQFVIKSSESENFIMCVTDDITDIGELELGDCVRILGRLKFDISKIKSSSTNSFNNTIGANECCKMYIHVDYLHIPGQNKSQQDHNIASYKKLQKTLASDKCIDHIKKIQSRASPRVINNIGIITNASDNKSDKLNIFLNSCTNNGSNFNVYVFRVPIDDMENKILDGFKYFQKYYKIDTICLIFESLSFHEIMVLSSKKIIGFLINRKPTDFPYLTTCLTSEVTITPLISELSNKHFNHAGNNFNFVKMIHDEYMNLINDNIIICKQNLQKQIYLLKQSLHETELRTSQLKKYGQNNHSDEDSTKDNPFDVVKILFLHQINLISMKIATYEKNMNSLLLDDHTLKTLIQSYVNAAKQKKIDIPYNSQVPSNIQQNTQQPVISTGSNNQNNGIGPKNQNV